MTFKELVNKVRNLVLEAKKVTIEDTENNFTSNNVEDALKEVFQSGVDAKNNVVTALNSKGAEVTTSDTWEEIKNKINDSKCSFDLFETTFNNKRFIINKIFDEDVKEMTLFHNDIDCYFIVAKFYIYKMDSNFNLIYKNRLTYNPDGAYIDENYIYIGDVYNLSKYDKESGNLVSSRTNIGCLYMCGDENYLYTVVTSGLGGVRPSEKFIKIDKLNLSTIVENGDGTDNSTYEFRYHEKFVMNSNNIYFMKTKHKKNSYNDYYQYLCKMNPNTLNIDTQLTIYNNVTYKDYVKGFVFIGDKIYLTKQRNIESALNKTLSVVDKDLNLTELGADTYSPNRDLITDGTYLYLVSAWSSPSRFDLEKINVSDFKKITEYSCHSDLKSFVTLCNNKICFTSSSGICLAILVSNILIQKEGEEL
ncbi:hypothetical protein KLM55_18275 [Clostridioides difficile]|nr:hypothetical protein [Clostridioides difficile]MCH4298356.1 hypothetical protein [Clostridioides difficile]MCI2271206.1 hypothetical protein [Clostridioides difficile]MCL6848857.1 hypothetical protein [Clostridioides difficile]MCP3376320.1 hypothetical protein [Clostridioides difficile]